MSPLAEGGAPCLPQGCPGTLWVGRPHVGLLGRLGGPVSCPSPHSWSRFLGDLLLQEGWIVLAAPSGAGPVLVPVRFPLCFQALLLCPLGWSRVTGARTGSWGCRCGAGNDLKWLPWEAGCGESSMPGNGPRSVCPGAGLAQVAAGACARGLMKGGCP